MTSSRKILTSPAGGGEITAVSSPGNLGPAALSPDEFTASQMEMTSTWFENLQKSGVDVDKYIEHRKKVYIERWQEAGRFIKPGAAVLDIGGGNLFPDLLRYFKTMKWDYTYFDIGENEVSASRRLAEEFGFDGSQFHRGLNHELHFEDGVFDAVFSSHCIEHSMNLIQTFRHLNRILKQGGELLIGVPLGWEENPNHPYFLLEDEWIALIEDSGFRIRIYQVGCEFPEQGYDLFIAAQKVRSASGQFRIDPDDFLKNNFSFHDFRAANIVYEGDVRWNDDCVLLEKNPDWRIRIVLPAGLTQVLPIFVRHDWSGKVSVTSTGDVTYGDLFRQNKTAQPLRLRLSKPSVEGQIVEIAPVGRNEASFASQGVFVGYMVR